MFFANNIFYKSFCKWRLFCPGATDSAADIPQLSEMESDLQTDQSVHGSEVILIVFTFSYVICLSLVYFNFNFKKIIFDYEDDFKKYENTVIFEHKFNFGIFLEKDFWTPAPPPSIKKCTKKKFLSIIWIIK